MVCYSLAIYCLCPIGIAGDCWGRISGSEYKNILHTLAVLTGSDNRDSLLIVLDTLIQVIQLEYHLIDSIRQSGNSCSCVIRLCSRSCAVIVVDLIAELQLMCGQVGQGDFIMFVITGVAHNLTGERAAAERTGILIQDDLIE